MKPVLTPEEKKAKREKKAKKLLELKLEKKNRIIKREKDKQLKKVEKAQSKPKTGFYFFKLEEEQKIKIEVPTIDKKDIHKELQKRWKDIKKTDKYSYYNELAIKYNTQNITGCLDTL